MRLLSPTGRGRQERREVAGNGESLRNVSRRERWARGTRKNAQTKTQSGGGEASEAVGAEQSLKKKKNQTAKRSLSPIHAPRHGFLLVETSGPLTHQQINGPTQIPWYRYETQPLFLGERGWESMSKSLPPSCQTPSPAPFGQVHPRQRQPLISSLPRAREGTLYSPPDGAQELRTPEPKARHRNRTGDCKEGTTQIADKASEGKTGVP